MRRSTLLTRVLGSAALACAAVALALVFVRYDAPAPRWDILSALGAAAVTAGAWALACRVAPRFTAAPPAGQQSAVPPLPGRLPRPARDRSRTAGAVLLLLTPLALARLAAGTGGVLAGVVVLLVILVTLKALLFARRQTSEADAHRKLRVLREDAGGGELHATRVVVGEPVRMRFLQRGDRPGEQDVTQYHWLVLRDGGHEIRLSGPDEEVARAAVRFAGQEGWICWPLRWKLIEGELPAAFVADNGEMFMGLADPDEARRYLTSTQQLGPRRAGRRLPRTAKFRTPVHGRILGGALLAALIASPVLYWGPGRLPALLVWLLCALAAGAVGTFALRGAGTASRALPDGPSWTVSEESDPSIA
ncbi:MULTISPECIES: hypothetical protein [unclassified Streptomyces]|uniref:hypothetical protein n=1 Tax=unclassified Streptomyces TaxID=2593676 RepID=UPI002E21F3E3|nr:hypothetical protein OG217_14210 [Streptomyces sp. NBC_01023]